MSIRFSLMTVALIILLVCPACGEPAPSAQQLPTLLQGTSVTIDGTLEPEEWNAAYVKTFAEGSKLLLMRDATYLYLAIRATTDEMIAANVYTEEEGEVLIRHVSAALGTAWYRPGEGEWLRAQDFQWQCRATDNSDASRAERLAFLEQQGWLAANSRRGTPNELEYQIEIAGETLALAVAFMRTSDPDRRIFLPLDLADDTTQPTPGGLPETRMFSPDSWMRLDLSN
ncbi:MAG: hypothetical protein PVI09_00615 [Anaerolineae bacterium]|jgi:hypothetical protein